MKKNKEISFYYNNISFLVLVFFTCFAKIAVSQIATGSPYSRYGIGDLQSTGFVQSAGMGGLTVGMRNDTLNPFFINIANPSSYTSNKMTTFEVGLRSNTVNFTTSSQSQLNNYTSLAYLAFAFPVTKWWGASFGLVPYSSVGYHAGNQSTIDSIGPVSYQYNGSGGINRFYIGSSFMPIKHLSVGLNASYMFGNITNERTVEFNDPSQSNYFNTDILNVTTIGSIYCDFGMQYEWVIRSVPQRTKILKPDTLHTEMKRYHKRLLQERVKVVFGFTFGPSTALSATNTLLARDYVNSNGSKIAIDTAKYINDANSPITIPLSLGYGITIKKGERWLVGADYAVQNWSAFNSLGETGVLTNSMRASLGAQYVPNAMTDLPNTFWQHVNYRAGIRYSKTFLDIGNTPLNDYSFSLGLGFPIGPHRVNYSFSMLNIGFEYGQLGTTNNNLLKENYYKLTLGFTFDDKWFIKPKFD
ncbi:MAG: hypothetical protein ABI199_05575 [Bacteroidia bacterium]